MALLGDMGFCPAWVNKCTDKCEIWHVRVPNFIFIGAEM